MTRRHRLLAAFAACLALGELATAATPESAALLPSDPSPPNSGIHDDFGSSVALEGNVAVVGGGSLGGAYVYELSGGGWHQTAKLGFPQSAFAWIADVAIDGGRIAVVGSTDRLARAVVFERFGQDWRQSAELALPRSFLSEVYLSIAIHGDHITVGNRHDSTAALFSGAVAVYRATGTSWVWEQTLYVPTNPGADEFGASIALDDDRLVVGAPRRISDTGLYVGAVLVYDRSGDTWVLRQELHSSAPGVDVALGWSVALDGDTLVADATFGTFQAFTSGRFEVFERQGDGTWTPSGLVTSADTAPDGLVPGTVGMRDGVIAMGAFDGTDSSELVGLVDLFVRDGGTWTRRARLQPSEIAAYSYFGGTLAVGGGRILAGAPVADEWHGAAYLFDLGCALDPILDPDGDNLCNPDDDCAEAWNPGQADTDGDGLGNACDPASCASVAAPTGAATARPLAALAPLVTALVWTRRLRRRAAV